MIFEVYLGTTEDWNHCGRNGVEIRLNDSCHLLCAVMEEGALTAGWYTRIDKFGFQPPMHYHLSVDNNISSKMCVKFNRRSIDLCRIKHHLLLLTVSVGTVLREFWSAAPHCRGADYWSYYTTILDTSNW